MSIKLRPYQHIEASFFAIKPRKENVNGDYMKYWIDSHNPLTNVFSKDDLGLKKTFKPCGVGYYIAGLIVYINLTSF